MLVIIVNILIALWAGLKIVRALSAPLVICYEIQAPIYFGRPNVSTTFFSY
jgi:hypothetical protein